MRSASAWSAPALLIVVLVLGPARALAQTSPDREIAQARELVLFARYPEAIDAGERILARTDLSAAQRNAALELIATAQIANRRPADARRTLATLYSRDPGHRLSDPDASPPVISAFARAREAQPEPIQVVLRHESPGTLARREPPTITLVVGAGADAVAEVRLAYRTEGEPGFSQVVMNARDAATWAARIPVVGGSDRALDVAYYLVALAPSGVELGRIGSEAEPLQLRIPAEVPSPRAVALAAAGDPGSEAVAPSDGGGGNIAEEPLFWILLALVVAGGATAGVVIATTTETGPEQGTLGSVTLMR